MRILLNMIVRNESHVITETLQNLVSNIKLDYYVISDTGSTDNTMELITNFFGIHGIEGELYSDKWVDFGTNRTLALKHAYGKSDYILIFDADDSINGKLILPEVLTADCYNLKMSNLFNLYSRPLLIKNTIRWKFKGVLHEHLTTDEPTNRENIDGDYYILSGRSGARNKNPNKYSDDAEVLSKAYYLAKNENDPIYSRYSYYCANSYYDAKLIDKAKEWYLNTLLLDGWSEEKYNSCLNLYEITKDTNYLVKSHEYNPKRVEGIFLLIKEYTILKEYSIAYGYYKFIQEYYENEYSTGKDSLSSLLFARVQDYTFFLPYYMVIVCERLKKWDLGIKMYLIIFDKSKNPPEWWLGNLLYNFKFYKPYLIGNNLFHEKMDYFLEINGKK